MITLMRFGAVLVIGLFLYAGDVCAQCDGQSGWEVGSYTAGEIVVHYGGAYECMPWPYSGWCGANVAYEPGRGAAWEQAWSFVAECPDSEGEVMPCDDLDDFTFLYTTYPTEGTLPPIRNAKLWYTTSVWHGDLPPHGEGVPGAYGVYTTSTTQTIWVD